MTDPFYHAHPDILFTQLNDAEAVLLGLATGHYYSLNETGIRIWETLHAGASLSEITEAVRQEYEVTHEEAAAHTATFLEDLLQENLIVKEKRR